MWSGDIIIYTVSMFIAYDVMLWEIEGVDMITIVVISHSGTVVPECCKDD